MSPALRFSFDEEPGCALRQSTTPLPPLPLPAPDPQATAPLADFLRPALPFGESPAEPPCALVPPLPPARPAQSRTSLRTAAWLVLLALDLLVLVYLFATRGR